LLFRRGFDLFWGEQSAYRALCWSTFTPPEESA
jgi:hypothetical protein